MVTIQILKANQSKPLDRQVGGIKADIIEGGKSHLPVTKCMQDGGIKMAALQNGAPTRQ